MKHFSSGELMYKY